MDRGRPPIFARPMSDAERVKRYRERRRNPLPPPVTPLAEARLRGLEYELLLRRELFHDRVPIEADLRQIATVIKAGLAAFATRYGSQIAAELDLPADRLAPLLQRVFDVFLAELGNMDAQIVEALDKAAAHWRRFPPERGKH